VLSTLYAAAVRRRRERYASRPELRRRLRRPVISVGNLAVGGRGKTPIVLSIARMLLAAGERPAILSRGYGRQRMEDGVVVVRDPDGMRADLARSGDEPLMLARLLPGASVLACPDRYLAGRLAEHHLGATIHVLDDGFQHLQLERDIDLLLIGREDLLRPVTLPAGRLREPLDTIVAADAVLATDDDVQVESSAEVPVYRVKRRGEPVPPGDIGDDPVFAVAGIARPGKFFDDLRTHGWKVAGTLSFRDHHRYTPADLRRVVGESRRAGAVAVVTTEKDLVRLLPFRPFAVRILHVPLILEPDPIDRFAGWLTAEIAAARGGARV
jgi:tetraacyldisaccharide 4'-kinase